MDVNTRILKVLLVEDNPADVYLLETAMRHVRLAYKLTVAHDGISAWDLLKRIASGDEPRPDLVVLDLNLPGLSGRHILARLQNGEMLLDLPILVFTGSVFENSIVDDFPRLRLSFQPKTPDFDELCVIVTRMGAYATAEPSSPEA